MFPNCFCGEQKADRTRTILGVGGKSTVVRCSQCHAYRWQAPEDYGKKPIYDEYKPGGRNFFEVANEKAGNFDKDIEFITNKEMSLRIAGLVKGTAKLLDCGCAFGYLLGGIRTVKPDWDLYGLEVNPAYAAYVKERGFQVFEGELEHALPPGIEFDIVVLSHALEHLEDPSNILSSIRRILKPSGYIVLIVPNINSVFDLYYLKEKSYLSLPYMHLWFFTVKTLRDFVEMRGYVIQECNTISSLGTGKSFKSFMTRRLNRILNAFKLGSSIFLVAKRSDEKYELLN